MSSFLYNVSCTECGRYFQSRESNEEGKTNLCARCEEEVCENDFKHSIHKVN